VAMGLSKAAVSLATNVFQIGFVRYFPLQTMGKNLYIMERIAQIQHSLHQSAQQIVVSIGAFLICEAADEVQSCQIHDLLWQQRSLAMWQY